jgi:hypothetical protein
MSLATFTRQCTQTTIHIVDRGTARGGQGSMR